MRSPFRSAALLAPLLLAVPARADDKPRAEQNWTSGIKLGAQFDIGGVVNAEQPNDGINFGRLFTDKSDQVQLNQLLLTAQRPTDPNAKGYDVGFILQGLYGSDARYLHYLGEFDYAITGRYQFTLLQANMALHLPWLTGGGIDATIGQFITPLGYETIDPSTNPFYTHSYIFDFALPFEHTGAYAISHVSKLLDLYLGVDTGNQTTFGGGDNNSEPAGLAGFKLILRGGKLSLLALTHIGPEDSTLVLPNANSALRYYNDAVLTWNATDKLALVTEGAYVRDDGFHAEAYGVAQYVNYTLNDHLTLNARAEIFRDNNNFFVAAFPGNLSYVNALAGRPATTITAPAPTTYSELTLGVTWKPTLPKPVSTLLIRPEIRYDRALDGVHAYNDGRSAGQFTFAADAVLGF